VEQRERQIAEVVVVVAAAQTVAQQLAALVVRALL
jgi:hypothetical protein